MITSERSAAKKWCPFVRQTWGKRNECVGGWSTTGDPAFNVAVIERTDPSIEHRCPCIGSSCMAWRTIALVPAADQAISKQDRVGYCGLAGPPLTVAQAEELAENWNKVVAVDPPQAGETSM